MNWNELRWNDEVSFETAKKILGEKYLDGLIETRGVVGLKAHAACRAAGAWDANERAWYVAWKAVERHL